MTCQATVEGFLWRAPVGARARCALQVAFGERPRSRNVEVAAEGAVEYWLGYKHAARVEAVPESGWSCLKR